LIAEAGLPDSPIVKGLKEGSYWHTIGTRYVNGPPEESLIKAIYNVWRSKYFVEMVTKISQDKVNKKAASSAGFVSITFPIKLPPKAWAPAQSKYMKSTLHDTSNKHLHSIYLTKDILICVSILFLCCREDAVIQYISFYYKSQKVEYGKTVIRGGDAVKEAPSKVTVIALLSNYNAL